MLEPVGTAPGLVVPAGDVRAAGRRSWCCPGPPRELQPMWEAGAADRGAARRARGRDASTAQRTLRLFGIPESEIAETLREAEREGVELEQLEVTTCLKRGEIEVVTRYEPDAAGAYDALRAARARAPRRHAVLDGRRRPSTSRWRRCCGTIDAHRIAGRSPWPSPAPGGLLAARLTEPPGSSEYVKGGVVAYANDAKVALAGVDPELIERHGAVSEEVAEALADGARARLGADVGVGVTGVAGPGGGTEEKPVGLVWLSVMGPEGASITRSVNLPGGRADVRDRATTVAMHLIRRLLLGEVDG